MSKKQVGVIGGGIVGTAIGFNLSLYEELEVTLLEKNEIGSGTTAKSAGTVCLLDDALPHWLWEVRLYGLETYLNMEREERGSAGFVNTGTLVVCTDENSVAYARTGIALAKSAGFHGEFLTNRDRISRILPDLNLDNALAACWTADDGYFDPTMAANTFVKKMRANGAKALTGTNVTEIKTERNRVTGLGTDQGDFVFDAVVDASGPWARFTGRMVGMELPIWHTKATVFLLAPPKKHLDYRFPILKYPRFYARPEGENIFICKAHLTMDLSDPMHAGIWDPDALPATGGTDRYFLEFLFGELEQHVPGLLDAGVARSWLGYRAEPPDFLPILGESPVDGYVLAIGCGGNGVIEAPTVGRDIAKYVAYGEKSLLMERLSLSRFETKLSLSAAPQTS